MPEPVLASLKITVSGPLPLDGLAFIATRIMTGVSDGDGVSVVGSGEEVSVASSVGAGVSVTSSVGASSVGAGISSVGAAGSSVGTGTGITPGVEIGSCTTTKRTSANTVPESKNIDRTSKRVVIEPCRIIIVSST
jgi:hypothetical protein